VAEIIRNGRRVQLSMAWDYLTAADLAKRTAGAIVRPHPDAALHAKLVEALPAMARHAVALVDACHEAAGLSRGWDQQLTHGELRRRLQRLVTALEKPHLGRLKGAWDAIPRPWRDYLAPVDDGLRDRVVALLASRSNPGKGGARRATQPRAIHRLARRWEEITGYAASVDPAGRFSDFVRFYLLHFANNDQDDVRRVIRRAKNIL